jgi:hypothetical protein
MIWSNNYPPHTWAGRNINGDNSVKLLQSLSEGMIMQKITDTLKTVMAASDVLQRASYFGTLKLYFSGKTINEHCHLGKANV